MGLKRLMRLLAAIWLLLLLATPALAQGSFTFTDEYDVLDEQAIRRAAQPLIDRGSRVAIYFVRNGGDADFRSRMSEDGLLDGNLMRTEAVGIYVAFEDRYSGILFGEQFNEALATNENFDAIRRNQLNPGLAEASNSGDLSVISDAYATALRAINDAVITPPVEGGGTNVNVDEGTFLPIIGFIASVLGLGVFWTVFSRQRKAANALAAARRRMEEAREQAGTIITEIGQRFRNAEEKAKFDKVSYPAAEVDRIGRAQAAARQQFVGVQTEFDNVGEQLARQAKPTIAQYDTAAQGYQQVRTDAESVSTALRAVETHAASSTSWRVKHPER
ncbi:hypothetical protein HC891_24370 [Candidatus Gracilibacteria bacterium]|nr:hypothetical protein [Candidatus Gracilibacteria bacterium]